MLAFLNFSLVNKVSFQKNDLDRLYIYIVQNKYLVSPSPLSAPSFAYVKRHLLSCAII